jgi:23S rRNA (guanosine2251-2'-O)-methyltransferase
MRKLRNEELKRKSIEQFKKAKKSAIAIILDNVRSQSNVGSIFRTADAFLAESICLCGITAIPPHREIQKTALGATESVQWKYYSHTVDALNEYRDNGYVIVGIEQAEGSVELQDMVFKEEEKYALIFGHEVNGVDQNILNQCDKCVEIPQFGTKHSFNIAISVGIVLWQIYLEKK